ncbi:LmbE-like protein [Favolaschia claudopus]|uniref:N-acetylglucosaminylphosphatidylinositol deacetylase n=1 Tax=Favolaschia claudopus TaxID=2862362 RepID=A0AAV9YZI6_9AGAR
MKIAHCIIPLLLLAFSLRPRTLSLSGISAEKHSRILLLTAHPDDETFFFSPTLTALIHMQNAGQISDVFAVCLSTGNARGLGKTRIREFEMALEVFGMRERNGFILDHPHLQDNKTAFWDPTIIARELYPFIRTYGITTILTFDAQGITGHLNHGSALAGAEQLLRDLDNSGGSEDDSESRHNMTTSSRSQAPRLFALHSRRHATKHLGPIAALPHSLPLRQRRKPETEALFVASAGDYITAIRAMMKHPSQLNLRWTGEFWKGLFSRYLWVNEWFEVVI